MLTSDCHILVLEDEPAILALVVASLRAGGFSQISASSSIVGARQCWHAQMGKFDLVLTDFSLPDGCAPEFIRDLVRSKPSLRVILMTGFTEDVLGLDGDLRRHVTLLPKPFRPTDLIELVSAEMKTASGGQLAASTAT